MMSHNGWEENKPPFRCGNLPLANFNKPPFKGGNLPLANFKALKRNLPVANFKALKGSRKVKVQNLQYLLAVDLGRYKWY